MRKLLCLILFFITSYCFAQDAFVEQKTITYKDNVIFSTGFGVVLDTPWNIGTGTGNTAITSSSSIVSWNGIDIPDPTYTVSTFSILLKEQAVLSTPGANTAIIFLDVADGDLKIKDDNGQIITIADFTVN